MKTIQADVADAMVLIDHVVQNYNRLGKDYRAEQVEVRHLPNTDYGAQKQCYNNSFRYILHEDNRALYVLGFVVYHGLAIEHAWIEKQGQNFDPTLNPAKYDGYVRLVAFRLNQIGKFVSDHGYPPALHDTLKL